MAQHPKERSKPPAWKAPIGLRWRIVGKVVGEEGEGWVSDVKEVLAW